jgi:hypothetical protein
MSSGDFEAELRQSVADNLSLIANAAKAAKARIGQSVAGITPAPSPAAAADADYDSPRPAVDFDAEEPFYAAQGGEPEGATFGQDLPHENGLPEGAIAFDTFDTGGVDDDGIPVWEDPP